MEENGDLETLRQIAGDPHGFILLQGWAGLDFRDEEQVAQLRKLLESLEREIIAVLEAANELHASAEFELHALIEKEPEMFDRVVARQIAGLEVEIAKLREEAEVLGGEIEKLTASAAPGVE